MEIFQYSPFISVLYYRGEVRPDEDPELLLLEEELLLRGEGAALDLVGALLLILLFGRAVGAGVALPVFRLLGVYVLLLVPRLGVYVLRGEVAEGVVVLLVD